MNTGHWFFLFVLTCLMMFSLGVNAQDEGSDNEQGDKDADKSDDKKDVTAKEGSKEKDSDAKDSTSEDSDTEDSDTEDSDTEDSDTEDSDVEDAEDKDTGEDLHLAPPKTTTLDMELDTSGLEKMNPAADLNDNAIFGEDNASSEAIGDWTERELEVLELHGYLRVRPELYHKFYIRNDDALFNRPMVQRNNATNNPGEDCRDKDGGSHKSCSNATLAGANMRLRLEPTLNISEEVWIKSQIDFLNNVMLGASPGRYRNTNSAYQSSTIKTDALGGNNADDHTNGDMILVRRAWGEVMTPLGQLRFGRMPDHWGLGMLHNAGNGINQDFGDTVDRLMFASKINNWYIASAVDFPSGGTSMTSAAGRPFDISQLDDSYQFVGILAYKHDEEDQAAMLKRGDWVVNTGLHFTYRSQVLSFEMENENLSQSDTSLDDYKFYRRAMWTVTPDLWFQFLHDTFHLELELAMIYGEIGNPDKDLEDFDAAKSLTLTQWGAVAQMDYGLLSDQLRIGIEFGFASGDKQVEGLNAPSTFDQPNNPEDNNFSAFSFNPAYNTDLILYHHILGTVSQSYYFKPWLRYDFLRSAMGKQLGMQFDVLYSRAVFSESTINNASSNLGIELNASIMYVSSDNFHMGIKYGVLFPLGAFKGTWDPNMDGDLSDAPAEDNDLTFPQTLQALLGISF